MIVRKSEAEIEGMARAGALLAETLALVAEHLEPGVEMLELDRIADEHLASKGASPTSKGYRGFPAALCISPNSMVVHGIPGGHRVAEGDLISVDVGITLEGLSIIRTLVGHGIGRDMHEDPQVPNFGEPGKGPVLEEGTVLAIEPMVNAGGPLVRMGDDGWAIYAQDGSLAAHFEFTVAVTEDGPRILTPWHEKA